jgi:hypothetical protein
MNLFDDFDDKGDKFYTEEELSPEEFRLLKDSWRKGADYHKTADARYAVKVVDVTPEILQERELYANDWVLAHKHLFPMSTGLKDFGEDQQDSIRKSWHVVTYGGRLAMAEPRGYAKTARTTNHSVLAVLQGKVKYALILAASLEKGNEILDAIKTELISNEQINRLYPAVCNCFEHMDGRPNLASKQTYNGKQTNIRILQDRIKFPIIDGEPSSGAIIHVKPKDKVRGLFTKVKRGDEAGRILRPNFIFFDDIQTDEDAENPKTVEKIIRRIKKGALFGGSHSKRVSCIMCCTPIVYGDVSTHFLTNEPGWEVVLYKMMKKPPERLDKWLNEYAQILLGYDKEKFGDALRAKLAAKKYVEDNYEELHRGSLMSWEWAYGWDEEPQTEISALQHAMNFLIIEGLESFESECQCNVTPRPKNLDDVGASDSIIVEKIHSQPPGVCPLDTKYISIHVDVNKDLLTFACTASPQEFRPHIIDYGTFPDQPGFRWQKGKITSKLSGMYPGTPEPHLHLYQGVIDLIHILEKRDYIREDGVILKPNIILVDVSYEYTEMLRALRDSQSAIVRPARGFGFDEKNVNLEEKKFAPTTIKAKHSFTVPTDTGQMVTYMDINVLKTIVHRGFKTRYGLPGSLSLHPEKWPGQHLLLAQHCNAELPIKKYNEKEDREVTVWEMVPGSPDNEYFDNIVGSIAGLYYLGCEMSKRIVQKMNMQDFINKQRKVEDE